MRGARNPTPCWARKPQGLEAARLGGEGAGGGGGACLHASGGGGHPAMRLVGGVRGGGEWSLLASCGKGEGASYHTSSWGRGAGCLSTRLGGRGRCVPLASGGGWGGGGCLHLSQNQQPQRSEKTPQLGGEAGFCGSRGRSPPPPNLKANLPPTPPNFPPKIHV